MAEKVRKRSRNTTKLDKRRESYDRATSKMSPGKKREYTRPGSQNPRKSS